MNRGLLLVFLLPLWIAGCATVGGNANDLEPLVAVEPSPPLRPTQPRVAWAVADALWGQRIEIEVPKRYTSDGSVNRYPIRFSPGEVLARALFDASKKHDIYFFPQASSATNYDILMVLEDFDIRARAGKQSGSTCAYTVTWRARAAGGRVEGPTKTHGEATMVCDTEDFSNGDFVVGLLTLGLGASLDVGHGYAKGLPKTISWTIASLLGAWRDGGALVDWIAADARTPPAAVEQGQRFQSQSKHREAYFYFERALRLDATYQPAMVFKGIALVHLGLPQDAATTLRQAQRIDPGTEEAHVAQRWLDSLPRN